MKIVHAIHHLRNAITHSAHGPAVAALIVAAAGLSAVPAQADTLTYPRSQTLGGWHERAYVDGTWTDLAPDVKSLISTDGNGDLRGFESGGAGAATRWLRSPAFTLDASGDLTIVSANIASSSTMPASDSLVPATKTSGGFAGIALRNVSTGDFVLTKSSATSWAAVMFTAAELEPYVGQVFTVDLISQSAGGDSLYVNRPITVPGTAYSPPSSFLSFTFPTFGDATIFGSNISITVPYGTGVTELAPTYTHNGASATPDSGSTQDFSNPVTYRVTASDSSYTDYAVTVNVTPVSSAKAMLTFGPNATITGTNIVWFLPYGTDVTNLVPTYTVSPFATGDPSSGSTQDFTNPVTYRVTAQDDSHTDYLVTAIVAQSTNWITFPRSQTLEGWHERAYVDPAWTDLAPDVKSLISTDGNGDLRGFETGGAGAATRWLRSPEFTLELSGDLTIPNVYMAGTTMPASDSLVPATKASGGFAGIALRNVSTGNFVLIKSAVTSWATVTFTAAELLPYVGQVLTVDILNQGTGDFYVGRPIAVPGTLGSVPSDPYGLWSNGTFANGPLTDKDPAHDPDGDGLTNQQEFAFGLDPTTGASSNPISEQLDPATGTFTYTRLATSELTYTVWTSTDLADWGVAPAAATQTARVPAVGGVETVDVTLTDYSPPSGGKLFVRVKAE